MRIDVSQSGMPESIMAIILKGGMLVDMRNTVTRARMLLISLRMMKAYQVDCDYDQLKTLFHFLQS